MKQELTAIVLFIATYFGAKILLCYYFRLNPFGFLKRLLYGKTAPPAIGYKIKPPEPPIKNFNEISENINQLLNPKKNG